MNETFFFSRKLGKWVWGKLKPISKEEWDSIEDEHGSLSAVTWDEKEYFRVVEYDAFTEDDCVLLTEEEWRKAGTPPAFAFSEEDGRKLDEKGLFRVYKEHIPSEMCSLLRI